MRKLTYYIACTIDGFIGDPEGDATSMFKYSVGPYMQWMGAEYLETIPTQGREMLGIDAENKHYDTVIQGLGSYQLALDIGITSPYSHLREFVATRSLAESPHPDVELIADDLVGRVRELKAEDSPWVSGSVEVRPSPVSSSRRSTSWSSRRTRRCTAPECRCSAPASSPGTSS